MYIHRICNKISLKIEKPKGFYRPNHPLDKLGCLRCESFCLAVLEGGHYQKVQIIGRKGIAMS